MSLNQNEFGMRVPCVQQADCLLFTVLLVKPSLSSAEADRKFPAVQTVFLLVQRNAPESAVQVAFFLPQLVQLLRADEGGMIQEFLFTAARRSTLFGHKLICTLRVRLSH